MASAKLVFNGTDSYGRHYERVLGDNNQWYFRNYEFNGYAKAWSRWAKCEAVAVRFEVIDKPYGGYAGRCRVAVIDGGFGPDIDCIISHNLKREKMPRYRLPD